MTIAPSAENPQGDPVAQEARGAQQAPVCPAFIEQAELTDVAAWNHCPFSPPFGGEEYFVCHSPDGCGRPCKVEIFTRSSSEPAYWIRYRYDQAGRLVQSIECQKAFSERFTLHEYDGRGRPLRTLATGRGEWLTEYRFGSSGLLDRVRTSSQGGDSETVYEYEHASEGHPATVRKRVSGSDSPLSGESVTTFAYAEEGRIETAVTTGSGPTESGEGTFQYRYDKRGRLSRVSWEKGTREFHYDDEGRLAGVGTKFSWDEGPGKYIRYTYDHKSRLIEIETPLRRLRYAYDCVETGGSSQRPVSQTPPYFKVPDDAIGCE